MMNFITRSGSTLKNGASTFRFAGCNAPWLGLIWPAQETSARYPTNGEIDDALETAVEMGASVVRSHTLGISVGNALSIWPSLNTTNTSAFAPIDYTLKRCNDLGLRLIIPLTDNYHYYHGGKHTFTDWRSLSDETQFYTNSTVIADFEAYISVILNRVNALTGVAYKNDPAILAWETGNELGNPTPPVSWTTSIATYLKSIDSNHLVIDGSYGINSAALSLSSVDIYSNHIYPLQISQITSDATTVSNAGKAYLIGEMDWRPYASSGSGSMYLDTSTAYAGSASAKVVVNRPDAYPYHVQFRQAGLSLVQGTSYTLAFAAKADGARNLQISVIGGASPYPVYFQPADFLIGTNWQMYSFAFTMSHASDPAAVLNFDVAQVVSTVWIDGVTLTPAGGSNLIVNGDMEAGSLSPWTMHNTNITPDSLSAFESSVESNAAISGDCFWSLMPHRDSSGFALQNDGFSLYYPGQESGAQANAQTLRSHAYTMSGLAVPAALVPAAPTLNAITKANGVYSISWRGVVGAETYALEQSTSGVSGPWIVLGSASTDLSTPVSVPALSQCWYRVRAFNTAGVAGPYSSVVGGPD